MSSSIPSWDDQLQRISAFFKRLTDAKLTANLVKSEFAKAQVVLSYHVVDQGQVQLVKAKERVII